MVGCKCTAYQNLLLRLFWTAFHSKRQQYSDSCYEIWDYLAHSYRVATNCLSIPVARWLLICDLTSKVTSYLKHIHDCYLDDVGVKLDSCM